MNQAEMLTIINKGVEALLRQQGEILELLRNGDSIRRRPNEDTLVLRQELARHLAARKGQIVATGALVDLTADALQINRADPKSYKKHSNAVSHQLSLIRKEKKVELINKGYWRAK